MTYERPLDFLNNKKGKLVNVKLKEGNMQGLLEAFDIHINIVLVTGKSYTFLRGDNIISVEEIIK